MNGMVIKIRQQKAHLNDLAFMCWLAGWLVGRSVGQRKVKVKHKTN